MLSNNFVNISLKDRGQAYSDAIEYKRSGLFVQTFQEFIAWDKNNGFKIKTPFNATFVFDKKGEKIIRFWWSDNQAVWQKWNLSRQTIKNGTIYKDHPYIGKVRQIWFNLAMGNIDQVWKDFSPNARIYDLNLIDKDYNNLTDHQKYVGEVFSKYDFISIDEVGYPDYIDYEGDGGTVLAWYNMIVKNKIYETILLVVIAFSLFRPDFWLDKIQEPFNKIQGNQIFELIKDNNNILNLNENNILEFSNLELNEEFPDAGAAD